MNHLRKGAPVAILVQLARVRQSAERPKFECANLVHFLLLVVLESERLERVCLAQQATEDCGAKLAAAISGHTEH